MAQYGACRQGRGRGGHPNNTQPPAEPKTIRAFESEAFKGKRDGHIHRQKVRDCLKRARHLQLQHRAELHQHLVQGHEDAYGLPRQPPQQPVALPRAERRARHGLRAVHHLRG